MTDFVTPDGGTQIPQATEPPPGQELVGTLHERVTLVAQLRDPDITLARAVATYLLYKRKRLSEESERGYSAILGLLAKESPNAKLCDLEPPDGGLLLEEFLAQHWSGLAPRTYNKSHSVISDFTKWHVARGTLHRDPMGMIERAKTRPTHRRAFTDAEVVQILTANTQPRDQIALRLLLFFGIRKGALRRVRLEHFNLERHELTIFTKGGKIQTLEIVDGAVWELLSNLAEPGGNYLLPKQTSRRRIPPTKSALADLRASLAQARVACAVAAEDAKCRGELAAVLDSLEVTDARLDLAVAAASTQTRVELAEAIGQHGAHLWWYVCLERAGVVEKGQTRGRRMHTTRHTYATDLGRATGWNMLAVQKNLGHSKVGLTIDTYTQFAFEDQEAAVDALPEIEA